MTRYRCLTGLPGAEGLFRKRAPFRLIRELALSLLEMRVFVSFSFVAEEADE